MIRIVLFKNICITEEYLIPYMIRIVPFENFFYHRGILDSIYD